MTEPTLRRVRTRLGLSGWFWMFTFLAVLEAVLTAWALSASSAPFVVIGAVELAACCVVARIEWSDRVGA